MSGHGLAILPENPRHAPRMSARTILIVLYVSLVDCGFELLHQAADALLKLSVAPALSEPAHHRALCKDLNKVHQHYKGEQV